MATKQDIEKLALLLSKYMETNDPVDWGRWIDAFMNAPLVKGEYAIVREQAKQIAEKRMSPVLREMK